METTNNQNPIDENIVNNTTLNQEVVQMNVEETQGSIRAKASWFFWISGLSLVNTFLASKGTFFIVGLAISQLVDSVAIEINGEVNYFVSLVAPAIFAIFGYFAYKFNRWAFIVGSIFYILDGLLYLVLGEWFAAGFHLFVLYKLFQGFREITEYEKEIAKLG